MSEIVFVVEMHRNSKNSDWHTRHDEANYHMWFVKLSQAILERLPQAIIMKNMIPKSYIDYDIYNNLI